MPLVYKVKATLKIATITRIDHCVQFAHQSPQDSMGLRIGGTSVSRAGTRKLLGIHNPNSGKQIS